MNARIETLPPGTTTLESAGAIATPAATPVPPNAKLALVLGAAAALSAVAVLPYLLELLAPAARANLPALPVLVALQLGQGLLLYTAMAWIGLRLGHGLGLDAPWLRRWVYGAPATGAFAWRHALWGAAGSAAMVLGVVTVLDPLLPAPLSGALPSPRPWQGLLASFYGGIAEELQLRLFLVGVLAWVAVRLGRGRIATRHAIALAIVLAALAFGALHLSAAAQVWPLDTLVVVRTVVANALPGLVFGWLYARHGIETAIIAHFTTDLLLHVVAPLLGAA